MKSLIRSPFQLSIILLTICLAACGGRLPDRLVLEQNPVFTGGIGWLVVSDAYARVKARPSLEAGDIGQLRGGEVLAVLGRERSSATDEMWYKVDAGGQVGWVRDSQAAFFETRETAERASAQYH